MGKLTTTCNKYRSVNSLIRPLYTRSQILISVLHNRIYIFYKNCQDGIQERKAIIRDEDIEALSKSSGMSKEDVKKAFDSFIEEHPNGKMKKGEFAKMMAQALPQKDAGKMEKHVFRVYDTNNDGYIDFVEFMVILHH